MKPKGIIIHHSATVDGRTFSWQAMRRYHTSYRVDSRIVSKDDFYKLLKKKKGTKFEKPWRDIGYHAGIELINDHYEVVLGRPLYMQGAHCKGKNDYIGFCYVGNYDKNEPSDDRLIYGITHFIVPIMIALKLPLTSIHYHREFANKTCPGRLFPDLADFRKMIAFHIKMERIPPFLKKIETLWTGGLYSE